MYTQESYEINSSTMAIIPIDDEYSKVYEEEEEYIIKQSSNKIIKDNCKFFGSSYLGRCAGTKQMTGIKSKFPIILEESRNIIFFPTSSPRKMQSCWFALNKIKLCTKEKNTTSKILFKNNLILNINISVYSFENQIVRSTMLKSKLLERKLEEKINK